jgi:glutathione S-transferase
MKLIYADSTCSLSVHILFEELGVTYEASKVDIKNKEILLQYNPKGYVPALVLDDGKILTEAPVILQYVADHYQASHLFPILGSFERVKCQEWLNFITTEVHKGFGPLIKFKFSLPEKLEREIRETVEGRFQFINDHLQDRAFLIEGLSIADMYLVAILRIAEHTDFDIKKFSRLYSYKQKMELLPSVREVLQEEKSSPLFSDRIHFHQSTSHYI